MRRILMAVLAAVVVGCAATGGAIPTATFNDKEALALRTVTTLRTTATQLMTAQKITVDQDVLIQKQLDLVVDGLKVARSLNAQKPEEASAQLTSALESLDALKKQLGVK